MKNDVLVAFEHVSKKFCRNLKRSMIYGVQDIAGEMLGYYGRNAQLRKDEFWALNDINFELKRGECLGLIGRNGSGKSTILKLINGLIKPDAGKVTVRGRVGALIELGAGFNPILTGRENIYINGAVLGLSKKEIDQKFDTIVDFAEIDEFIDTPVQNYSSGMKVRLGFAVAAQMEPDVLLIDEVLAVGDVNFQRKCQIKIKEMIDCGVSIIFVTHNMNHIQHICDSAILVLKGQLMIKDAPVSVIEQYMAGILDAEKSTKKFNHVLGIKNFTGEITISKLKILSIENKEIDFFKTGDALKITAEYETKSILESPVLQIGIYRLDDGLPCIVERSTDQELIVPTIMPGKGMISFIFPNILLKTGTYIIEILISDKMAIHSYIRERGGPFNIVSKIPSDTIGNLGLFHANVTINLNQKQLIQKN